MRIALDVMGGDYAPENNIIGLKQAIDSYDGISYVLVGDAAIIEQQLKEHNIKSDLIEVVNASQVVEMNEPSTVAIRQKKNSSITVAAKLMKEGRADAVVSAGHTGAAVATSVVFNRTIEGVDRPGIAAVFPSEKGNFVVLDVGANVDAKPRHLAQYAIMGEAYSQLILGKENPKVGILSVGAEDGKGNELTKQSFDMISQLPLNFVGNVEGNYLFNGDVDVVVCDGFVGNAVLKFCEGLAKTMTRILKDRLSKTPVRMAGALLSKNAFQELKHVTDHEEYGGAPLLGINGTCIIAHGSSSPKAIKNAIRVASEMVSNKLNSKISTTVNQIDWDAVEQEKD